MQSHDDRPGPNWNATLGVPAATELLIVGAWIGLMATPTAALDVPVETIDYGIESAAYIPTPEWLILASLVVVPAAARHGLKAAGYSPDISLDREWSGR